MAGRLLRSEEVTLAQTVFGRTIPYNRIYISDIDLGGAVTVADMFSLERGIIVPKATRYFLCWKDGFISAIKNREIQSVFIHELTHVWQGERGIVPVEYMGRSASAQLSHGISDIIKNRKWRGWGVHRSTAYDFAASDIGKNWNQFNVEQQCNIVQSWYTDINSWSILYPKSKIIGGNSSRYDPRYPYISDVIQAKNRGARYKEIALPAGGDAKIKKIQDRLVFLGYLKPQYADGVVGRTKSATLDAVAAFQRRNGLTVDRDLGGPNSNTQKKLMGNTKYLVRAL